MQNLVTEYFRYRPCHEKYENYINENVLSISNIFKNFNETNEIAIKYIRQLLKNDKTLKKYCLQYFSNFNTYTIGKYTFVDRDKYDNDYICLRLNANVLCVNFVRYHDDTVEDCSIILEPHHFYGEEIKNFIDIIFNEHIENCKKQEIEVVELEKQRQEKALIEKEAFELAEFKRLSKKFKANEHTKI